MTGIEHAVLHFEAADFGPLDDLAAVRGLANALALAALFWSAVTWWWLR